jgi:hypothetical protein
MADEPTATPDPATATPTGDGSPGGEAVGSGVEETPEALRARIADLERIHEQDKSRLSSGEEARREADRLRAELEQSRGRGHQPPTASDPMMEQIQRDYEAAKAGDPEAILRVVATVGQVSQNEVLALRRENAYAQEMASVPSEMRDQVRQKMKDHPGLSPSWAQKDIEAEMYRKERAALDARRKQLDDEEAARKRGRVDTSLTGISGGSLQNAGITATELAELSQKAERGDTKAIERLRAFDRGELGRLKEA